MESLVYALIFIVKNTMFRQYSGISTSLIVAQSKLETGNFTSAIFNENKNLFGMKVSTKTKGGFIETGESRGHAVYKNIWDSIRDYFVRQREFKIDGSSNEKYITSTVSSGYAEAKNYNPAWSRIFEDSKPKRLVLIGLVLAVLGAFWYIYGHIVVRKLGMKFRIFKNRNLK